MMKTLEVLAHIATYILKPIQQRLGEVAFRGEVECGRRRARSSEGKQGRRRSRSLDEGDVSKAHQDAGYIIRIFFKQLCRVLASSLRKHTLMSDGDGWER